MVVKQALFNIILAAKSKQRPTTQFLDALGFAQKSSRRAEWGMQKAQSLS